MAKKVNWGKIIGAIVVVIAIIAIIFSVVRGPYQEDASEVKFGLIYPLTGTVGSIGLAMSDAASLAVEEINAAGGINGKTFKLIVENGECKAEPAVRAANKLINIDGVQAIIGGACSAETAAFGPVATENQVVVLSPSSTRPGLTLVAGDYVFRNIAPDTFQGAEGASIAHALGAQNIAVFIINDEYGVGLRDVFVSEAEALGMNVVASESHEKESKDVRTQLTKIKELSPDLVYMVAFPQEAGLALRQAKELGLDVQFVAAEAMKDDEVITAAGGGAEGVIVTTPRIAYNNPVYEVFKVAYADKFGREPDIYAGESYDAARIIMDAIGNTDGSGAAIREHMLNHGEYHLASGTYEFDANREVMKEYQYWIVQDGAFVPYEISA